VTPGVLTWPAYSSMVIPAYKYSLLVRLRNCTRRGVLESSCGELRRGRKVQAFSPVVVELLFWPYEKARYMSEWITSE
jgi:hypothetical protein